MIDLTGTQIAESELNNNPFCFQVQVKWDGTNWTDETWRVQTFRYDASTIEPIGSVGASRFAVTFNSADRYFDQSNTNSPIYDYIKDDGWRGKEIRFLAGFYTDSGQPEYVQRFIGHLVSWELSGDSAAVEALDKSYHLLSRTARTQVHQGYFVHDALNTLLSYVPADIRPELIADTSYVKIPVFWLDNDNVWEEIARLAQVEGGAAFMTHDGKLRFLNAEALLGQSDPVASVVWLHKLERRFQWNQCAKVLRVAYYVPIFAKPSVVWQLRERVIVPPGWTRKIVGNLEGPAVNLSLSGIRAETYSGFGVSVNAQLNSYGQEFSITVSHSLNCPVIITAASVTGSLIRFRDAQMVTAVAQDDGTLDFSDSAIDSEVDARTFQIRNNWYVQSYFAAERLVYLWAWRLAAGVCHIIMHQPRRMFWLDPFDVISYRDEKYLITRVLLIGNPYPVVILRCLECKRIAPNVEFFELGVDPVGGSAKYFL